MTRNLRDCTIRDCAKGATAIEYALLAALIATAAVAAFMNLGNEVENSFTATNEALAAQSRPGS